MYNEIVDDLESARVKTSTGTIIARYADIFDDRLENSGNSRSTTSLALYSAEQLKKELKSREED
jgi:hypothetical protein